MSQVEALQLDTRDSAFGCGELCFANIDTQQAPPAGIAPRQIPVSVSNLILQAFNEDTKVWQKNYGSFQPILHLLKRTFEIC